MGDPRFEGEGCATTQGKLRRVEGEDGATAQGKPRLEAHNGRTVQTRVPLALLDSRPECVRLAPGVVSRQVLSSGVGCMAAANPSPGAGAPRPGPEKLG
jgi:hypothetical protein